MLSYSSTYVIIQPIRPIQWLPWSKRYHYLTSKQFYFTIYLFNLKFYCAISVCKYFVNNKNQLKCMCTVAHISHVMNMYNLYGVGYDDRENSANLVIKKRNRQLSSISAVDVTWMCCWFYETPTALGQSHVLNICISWICIAHGASYRMVQPALTF